MSESPITNNIDLVTFQVKANGSEIDGTYQVHTITVDRNVNRVSYCELELLDGNVSTEDFPISDSDDFVPGSEVEILAGYENKNSSVFKGIVTSQSIRITKDAGSVLVVTVKDKSIKMTVGRNNAYYTKTKDSDIISKLIEDHGLSADVSSTSAELKEIIQYYATDWDFMLARADINGMIVLTQDGKVSVKKPDEETSEVLTLNYGDDILEFEGELNSVNQLKSIKSASWDYSSQKITNGEANTGNYDIGNVSSSKLSEVVGLSAYDLQTPSLLSSGELTAWSKALATKSEYAKITGYVKFQGSDQAYPGKIIELNGVGKRFTGKGFISGVTHEIHSGNWITTATIGLSTEWFTAKVKTESPSASGLLPGIQGLQIGKVKQINEDPDNEFRVLIELPMITSGTDGVWARLAGFYASKEIGAFFYPEVDDEVIVGFLNDDPGSAIILGSVYSSAIAAPFTPDEKNNTKAIVTREKMKITFDEEKKIITVITPSENQLELSDEGKSITIKDQNGNSVKMSESGIDMKSATNISITAEESVTIKGNTGVTVQASAGDVSVKGLNVSCSGEIEFKAEGVNAQVSGTAMTKVQGAMVMIN
ncbi:MAG: type VI secretion system tip protein VgrG [Cyclobacteriaceae bacterium]